MLFINISRPVVNTELDVDGYDFQRLSKSNLYFIDQCIHIPDEMLVAAMVGLNIDMISG